MFGAIPDRGNPPTTDMMSGVENPEARNPTWAAWTSGSRHGRWAARCPACRTGWTTAWNRCGDGCRASGGAAGVHPGRGIRTRMPGVGSSWPGGWCALVGWTAGGGASPLQTAGVAKQPSPTVRGGLRSLRYGQVGEDRSRSGSARGQGAAMSRRHGFRRPRSCSGSPSQPSWRRFGPVSGTAPPMIPSELDHLGPKDTVVPIPRYLSASIKATAAAVRGRRSAFTVSTPRLANAHQSRWRVRESRQRRFVRSCLCRFTSAPSTHAPRSAGTL